MVARVAHQASRLVTSAWTVTPLTTRQIVADLAVFQIAATVMDLWIIAKLVKTDLNSCQMAFVPRGNALPRAVLRAPLTSVSVMLVRKGGIWIGSTARARSAWPRTARHAVQI